MCYEFQIALPLATETRGTSYRDSVLKSVLEITLDMSASCLMFMVWKSWRGGRRRERKKKDLKYAVFTCYILFIIIT